jgi:hypothetical protein
MLKVEPSIEKFREHLNQYKYLKDLSVNQVLLHYEQTMFHDQNTEFIGISKEILNEYLVYKRSLVKRDP